MVDNPPHAKVCSGLNSIAESTPAPSFPSPPSLPNHAQLGGEGGGEGGGGRETWSEENGPEIQIAGAVASWDLSLSEHMGI